MPIQDNGTRDQYTATGGQTIFPYTFEIFDEDDIAVEQNDVLLTKGTHYTVSGVNNDSGGNVTLVTGATAGDTLTLYRNMTLERVTDYQDNGDFLADTVDNDFDRVWAALQQVFSNSNLGIRPSVTDTALNSSNTILADIATRGGKALGFAADGTLSYLSSAVPNGDFTHVSTVAAMKALTGITAGVDVIQTAEFSTGNGGGGVYDAIATGTTPLVDLPNGRNIIQSTANPAISFKLRTSEFGVSIAQLGAVRSADCADYINAAWDISDIALIPSGGQYQSSKITHRSFKAIKGVVDTSGWARLAATDYTFFSSLKLVDGANEYLIDIPANTTNWVISNLILDGNKANQTSYNSGTIKSNQTTVRNFGGLISGVKSVNSKGWGAYLTGGPLNIINCFFMSGALLVDISDLHADTIDFDGTDGLHNALIIHRSSSIEHFNGIFAFGNGETDNTKQIQEVTGTSNASGDLTISTPGWLYEGAPVSMSGQTPTASGSRPNSVFFAHFVSGTTWEIYTYPFENSKAVKATTTAGAFTLRHGGNEGVAVYSDSTRIATSNARFGGGKGQGLTLINVNRSSHSGMHFFNNNLRTALNAPSLEIIDSNRNGFTASQFGDVAKTPFNSVLINETAAGFSSQNAFDSSCGFDGCSSDVWVVDNSAPEYNLRNKFNPTVTPSSPRRYTSTLKDKEPGILNGQYLLNGDQVISASTNTTLTLTERQAEGLTVSGGNTINIPVTIGGLYRVHARFGLSTTPAAQVLYKISGLGAVTDAADMRTYSSDQTCNVEITFRATTETTVSLQFIVFSTSGFTITSSSDFSWISVDKVSDTLIFT